MILRDVPLSRIKVERKDFSKLLDTKWPDGDRKAVKKTASVFFVVIVDSPQHTFVCLIQCFG